MPGLAPPAAPGAPPALCNKLKRLAITCLWVATKAAESGAPSCVAFCDAANVPLFDRAQIITAERALLRTLNFDTLLPTAAVFAAAYIDAAACAGCLAGEALLKASQLAAYLLDLALLAGATMEAIVWLLGLDVMMIATGFFAGVTSTNLRWVWFIVSSVIFVWLLWVLLAEVLKAARQRPPEVRSKFNQLAILLAVLWTIYPILWILGTEGLNVIGITGEVATFTVIDLIAKVGFGFLLLSNRKVLDAARPATA